MLDECNLTSDLKNKQTKKTLGNIMLSPSKLRLNCAGNQHPERKYNGVIEDITILDQPDVGPNIDYP